MGHKDHQVQFLTERPIQKSNPQPDIISTMLCLPHPCHRSCGSSRGVSCLLLTMASPLQWSLLVFHVAGSSHVAKHDEMTSLFSNVFDILQMSLCCLVTRSGDFSLLFLFCLSSVYFCLSLAYTSLWKKRLTLAGNMFLAFPREDMTNCKDRWELQPGWTMV